MQYRPASAVTPPSEGFKPNQQPFHVKHLPGGKGAFLALLAITDLQCTLLKEQGLCTEFTLDRAEGVPPLLCERKVSFFTDFSATWLTSN